MKHWTRIAMLAAAAMLVFTIPSRAEDVAALYKAKCAVCHGADGKGDTAAGKKMGVKDFHSPEIVKAKDAELVEVTIKGKNKMPGYDKKLTEDQIKELIKYIRSLK